MEFGYRHSICQDRHKLIILEVNFELSAKSQMKLRRF